MIRVPAPFLIDVLDVAVAAGLWDQRRWEDEVEVRLRRQTTGGLLVHELVGGYREVDSFLNDFEYDAGLVGLLASHPSLGHVDARFWEHILGVRFRGRANVLDDGKWHAGGDIARLSGPAGPVTLFRFGVTVILCYITNLATQGKRLAEGVGPDVKRVDGGSATSYGHGWSLWAARAAWLAGSRPDVRAKKVVGVDSAGLDHLGRLLSGEDGAS